MHVHPSLQGKRIPKSRISGGSLTLRTCLDSLAKKLGARVAVRCKGVHLEPAAEVKREDLPTWPCVLRVHGFLRPNGVSDDDLYRVLKDIVFLGREQDSAVLVLSDHVLAITLDTFERHSLLQKVLSVIEKTEQTDREATSKPAPTAASEAPHP